MSQFVLIRHKVRDFNAWKKGFDAHAPKRAEAGLSDKQVLRNADDGNEVVLLFDAKDLALAKRSLRPPTCARRCKRLAWPTSRTSTS